VVLIEVYSDAVIPSDRRESRNLHAEAALAIASGDSSTSFGHAQDKQLGMTGHREPE
jgi:hypothetical protein